MTPTEKHRETAREVFRDYLKRIEYDRRPCFEHDELIQELFATALAKAEREGMKRAARELIDAWEELPDGDHDIDTANAWFANSLFPVLERFKMILSEAGEG